MPLLARVEWRSEGRAAERPTALVVGEERIEVEVVEHWVEGPAVAGGEVQHHFVVTDGQGREYRIRRASSGRVVVEALTPRSER